MVVLLGASGLAANAKLYCAPFSVREARLSGLKAQMTILGRADFARPQIAAMVRAGRVVSHASYMGNPDYFVVSVLQPFEARKHGSPGTAGLILGFLSILTTMGVSVSGICLSGRGRGGRRSGLKTT